ncbi:MAG: hypothetical protein N2053_12545 [Chitinispirillaceae bacterium]|nr:hypothetical protein [Chitinispirillaceae bacterium]
MGPKENIKFFSFTLPEKHIYVEAISFSLVTSLIIIGWIPAIFSFLQYEEIIPSAWRALIFLNFTALMIFCAYLFLKKGLKKTVYVFTDEYIIFKSLFTLKEIYLGEIKKISFFPLPLSKGFISIEGEKEVIVIPLSLKNITSLVYRLEQIAIEFSIPLSNYNWNELRIKAQFSEYHQNRASFIFKPLITTSILMLPFNFFVGAIFWDMSLIPLMLWSLTGSLMPILSYAISDLIINIRVEKRKKIIEDAEEKRIYVWCGIGVFCFYLFFSIIYNAII